MGAGIKILLCAAVFSVAALGGCDRDPYRLETLDDARKFFAKNKIGASPDFGVIKWGNPEEMVITVHGFMDDSASCTEVIEALNTNACEETGGQNCLNPFSCLILNQ